MYPEDLGLGVNDCAIWLKWLGHSDRGAILGPETMLRGCGGGRVKIHPQSLRGVLGAWGCIRFLNLGNRLPLGSGPQRLEWPVPRVEVVCPGYGL